MKRKIEIEYSWSCAMLPEGIPDPLAEALEDSAEAKISAVLEAGAAPGGDLYDLVRIDLEGYDCPADGYECRGNFTIKHSVVDPPLRASMWERRYTCPTCGHHWENTWFCVAAARCEKCKTITNPESSLKL